jgi:type IV pilus assembly protein PilE
MIALAIVSILAAVALPSYNASIQKSRRSDAINNLLKIQLQEEKFRANNTSYTADLTTFGYSSTTNATSSDGYYTLNITAASATGYSANAAPKTGTAQASDTCTLTITQNGPTLTTAANRTCWGK